MSNFLAAVFMEAGSLDFGLTNGLLLGSVNTSNQKYSRLRYKNLALSSQQGQCMKVGSKLYYCCNQIAMTLNLPLSYLV